MLTGLWKLTWLEIKIFLREPLGVLGSIGMPLVFFFVAARLGGGRSTPPPDAPAAMLAMLPVLGALLIAVGAGQSLVAVISIYREGGILKRLRAKATVAAHINGRAIRQGDGQRFERVAGLDWGDHKFVAIGSN